MYEEYFGLKEAPFQLTPDPDYLYFSAGHRKAYDDIVHGLRRRSGLLVLTGEAGTGKSTILRAAGRELQAGMQVGMLFKRQESARALLESTCEAFGVPSEGATSRNEFLRRMHRYLQQIHAMGETAVLFVDEAHELGDDALEVLRELALLDYEGRRLLQIVFAGQPELLYVLENPHMRQLNELVVSRIRLPFLAVEETSRYIQHRLAIAGSESATTLFNYDAMQKVYSATSGVPRRINLLCENALVMGYVRGATVISGAIIDGVTREPGAGGGDDGFRRDSGFVDPPPPAPPKDRDERPAFRQDENAIYNPDYAAPGPAYNGPDIFTDETAPATYKSNRNLPRNPLPTNGEEHGAHPEQTPGPGQDPYDRPDLDGTAGAPPHQPVSPLSEPEGAHTAHYDARPSVEPRDNAPPEEGRILDAIPEPLPERKMPDPEPAPAAPVSPADAREWETATERAARLEAAVREQKQRIEAAVQQPAPEANPVRQPAEPEPELPAKSRSPELKSPAESQRPVAGETPFLLESTQPEPKPAPEERKEGSISTSRLARYVANQVNDQLRDYLNNYFLFRKPASLWLIGTIGVLSYVIAILLGVLLAKSLLG